MNRVREKITNKGKVYVGVDFGLHAYLYPIGILEKIAVRIPMFEDIDRLSSLAFSFISSFRLQDNVGSVFVIELK
jgi:hypothetical protein